MKKTISLSTPLYPAPCIVIGVYDPEGVPGGMFVAWGGVCCSEPPCISVGIRKSRYSFEGITAHGAFTVNIPSEEHAAQADYFGIYSGRDENKFIATGLTPRRGEAVNAPMIEEFPLSMECRVVHSHDLGSHVLFVGEVVRTWALEESLNDSGYPDPLKVRPLVFAPQYGAYYGLGDVVGHAFKDGRSLREREV